MTNNKKRKLNAGVATIHEVAARAGVSIKTVSRVVNQEPNVRPETVRTVQQAISELNYRPNFSARNLAGRRAYLIALVYDNPSDSYIVGLQDGALQACRELGYSVLLHPTRYDSPHMIDDLLTMARERRPSGLILTPPLCDMQSLLDAVDSCDIPYALISALNHKPNTPVVSIDDRLAGYDLTTYLLAQGHRRIGFIKGHPHHSAALRRYEGYVDAHREYGIEIDRRLVVQGWFSFESGVECARALLSRSERPTAIFASNDDMAAGVLHVAHELELNVPNDLSVAGFDDTPLSRYVWPRLTTVRQPIRLMAEAAVRALIASVRRTVDTELKTPLESIRHELVVRESTARAKR